MNKPGVREIGWLGLASAFAFAFAACGRAPSSPVAAPSAPAVERPRPADAPTPVPAVESPAAEVPTAEAPAAEVPALLREPLRFDVRDEARAAATDAAVRRAWPFLRDLDPDPVRLRDQLKMKGHKHFTEYLSAMRLLAAWARTPEVADAARARGIEVLERYAKGPGFHNLAQADDARLDEDSMSYLRGCLYAEQLGWDTKAWRAEIATILPRLRGHIQTRGTDQRMAFAFLFEALGLPGGESLAALQPLGAIATQRSFESLVAHPENAYDFTHEVFALTWRGRRPLLARSEVERTYARKMAYTLLHIHATEKLHDSAAELLLNRIWLGEAPDPQILFARQLLLDGQREDGSIGFHTESLIREKTGNPVYEVRYGGYLHTTMVALWALMASS